MSGSTDTLIREAYADFARGNFDGYFSACTDDWTFHTPGSNRASGTYRGRDGLMAIVGVVGEIAGDSFREEVTQVFVGDTKAVVVLRHTLQRDGRTHAYDVAHVYHLSDGKLAECWECPADMEAFDAAWA